MLTNTLKTLYRRDLEKLKKEMAAYSSEALIWAATPGVQNTPGNLCLHLVGNLNHFIGAVLGATGYVRQRDREFSDKDVPREELYRMADATADTIDRVMDQLSAEDLEKTYPLEVLGKTMTTGYFMVHLLTHFDYHLGQINYHRRMTDL